MEVGGSLIRIGGLSCSFGSWSCCKHTPHFCIMSCTFSRMFRMYTNCRSWCSSFPALMCFCIGSRCALRMNPSAFSSGIMARIRLMWLTYSAPLATISPWAIFAYMGSDIGSPFATSLIVCLMRSSCFCNYFRSSSD